jgi:hypothetical protein
MQLLVPTHDRRASRRGCDSPLPILQYRGTHKHDIRVMRNAPYDRDDKYDDRDEARPRANVLGARGL